MTTTEVSRYRGYEIVSKRQWSSWCVGVYPTRADLMIFTRSTLQTLAPRKADAVAETIDRIFSCLGKVQS
jgi:hypothetical protein